jgi:hypothetical protein
MRSHFLHLLLFSGIVSTFFAFLARNDAKGRWRVGFMVAASMVGISLLLAWVMYPFPVR